MSSINFNPAKKIRINNKEIKKVCHMTTVVWSSMEETYNYFVVEPTAEYMSVALYENLDKAGEATAYATDWGDGTVDNNTSHTYSKIGTYTIKTKLQPGSSSSDNNNITECLGIRKDITSMKNFFKNAKALVKCCSIPDTILNVEYAFSNCTSFNQEVIIPPNVTSMCGTFEGCTALNSNIIIPDGVVDMSDTFWKCSSFNQNIKLPSQLKKMYCTFQASGMNQQIIIPDGVTDMCGAFQQCSSFNQLITIPNSVTRLEMTFHSCTNLNQPIVIPKNVTNMARIFYNCISFNQPIEIPQSMKNMYCAFQGATSFNQDIEIPSGIETIYGLLHSVGNSYNSLITLNFDIEDSLNNNTKYDPIAVQLFTYNSSANRIKICGGINNNSFKILLSQLSNPTTIDIRELNSSNIYDIVLDEEIMNIIDTGKNGTPHTLLWADPTYNYFKVEPYSEETYLRLYEVGFEEMPEMPMSMETNSPEVAEAEVYYTDWGDGTVNTETEHTYSEYDRAYIIKTKLTPGGGYNEIITECLNIRNDVQEINNFLSGCGNLTKVCKIPDGVTNISGMFSSCYQFNQKIIIPNSVTNISCLFDYCQSFNQPVTIPDSVVNMDSTFYSCSSFNQPVVVPNNVTSLRSTFSDCSSLNSTITIGNSVTNMQYTFYGCNLFNQPITIPNSVTNMNYTFYGCSLFNQPITIPNSVNNIEYTFYGCSTFNQPVTIPNNVNSLYETFYGCLNFNQPVTIPDSVLYMHETFYNCKSLNSTVTMNSHVISMANAFQYCTNFNKPITIPDSTTDLSRTFYGCSSLNSNVIIGNGVVSMDYAFYDCVAFNKPIIIPNSVKYLPYTFYNCTSLNSEISLGTGMTSLGNTFENCTAFNQNITIPNNVTSMNRTFKGCTALNSIVTLSTRLSEMTETFYECTSFNQPITIPNSVTSMSSVFSGCNSLNSVVTFVLNNTNNNKYYSKIFENSSLNSIKFEGDINSSSTSSYYTTFFSSILNCLTVASIVDIRELSYIADFMQNTNIMNIINTGKNGTPHTLLWMDETYNYFTIEPSNTNGMSVTLYENPDKVGDATAYATDWGDGTVDNNTSHTYSTVGTYTIKTKLQPNNKNTGNYNKLIKKVINVRNDISNFDSFCLGCENLEQFNIDNTIHPTNMCAMFGNCSSLTSIDMTKFDTTNTVNLGYLFNGCTSLSTIIGLENLNAKNVEVIYNAFTNTPIIDADLSKWGCKNISSIYGLFDGCKKLRSVNLTGWDIPNANSLKKLFYNCYELASIKGIEDWDTSNVTDMGGTFRECKPLKTLDLSRWNVSKVESMNRMFNQCGSLETVGDLSNWITPVLTDATYMFNNTKIKSLKLTNFDTSNVTSAAHIFNCGADLEEYDIVITFGDNDYMPFNDFAFCSSIKYITIKGVPDVTRMISFVGILKDQTATGAILDISQLSDEIRNNLMANTTLVDNARAKGWKFSQYSLDDLEHFNYFEITTNNTNGYSITLYENPEYAGDAAAYTTDWGDGTVNNSTSHTYSTNGTYTIKTKLQPSSETNKNSANTNIVKCIGIREDITNLDYFFNNCTKLSTIENSVLLNVTTMKWCFNNCSSLVSINISNWDLTNVVNMSYMFKDCVNLTSATFSNTTTLDSLENGENVFYNCTSLTDTNLLDQI